MKTLKLFSLLVVTGFLTMSMGFPTDLTTGKNGQEKKSNTDPKKSHVVMAAADVNKNNAIDAIAEDEPAQALSMPGLSNISKITVKVFDVKGSLIMKQEVSMDEFLSKSKAVSLPNGSTFVMFHENTAYYFLETGLLN